MENKDSLKRQLSPMHVWAIAFGCVIGWGSFINPGKKFLPTSGVAGTAIAMVLGAAVMIILAFSIGILPRHSSRIPWQYGQRKVQRSVRISSHLFISELPLSSLTLLSYIVENPMCSSFIIPSRPCISGLFNQNHL